jgi:hypothetical protein
MGAMKTPLLSLVLFAVAIASASAYSDYVYVEQALIQPRFDRLIPTFYPTIQPDFNNLLQTTASPLIYPDLPRIHITENLSHPTDRRLLIAN